MSHHTPRAAQHYTALHSTTHTHTHTHPASSYRSDRIRLCARSFPNGEEGTEGRYRRKIHEEDTGGRYVNRMKRFHTQLLHGFNRVHVHPFIHSYTHALMHPFIHSCTHSCTHSYIHTLIHAYTHVPMYTLMHSCTHSLHL